MSIDDVFEFAKEQKLLRSRAKGTSVFAKQEWDEYVICEQEGKL